MWWLEKFLYNTQNENEREKVKKYVKFTEPREMQQKTNNQISKDEKNSIVKSHLKWTFLLVFGWLDL